MGPLATADRRDALDFRQTRVVGRPAPDGPSRQGDDSGGTRSTPIGRAGLRTDGWPLSADSRPRRGGRAPAPAATAGMGERKDPERFEIAERRASARRDAPPRG